MSKTYETYLCLEEVLGAQRPESTEKDELLFVIIHQVYELWFKQVLHEFTYLRSAFEQNQVDDTSAILKRVRTILKTMVGQTDILETMTPLSFVSFRDRLGTSSGFQSHQFRQFEFWLGNKNRQKIENYQGEKRAQLEAMLPEPTLMDSFLVMLKRNDYEVPEELLERDCSQLWQPNEELQRILLQVYRNNPQLTQVCELLVDLDEGIQEWRYRHVKMVERTIGQKIGTGGSAGAEYLRRTLFQPAFPDLWQIRSSF